ncbi:MAG TPA: hypothetical protein VF439_02915 [Candidatus Paceibacterota bacterium]
MNTSRNWWLAALAVIVIVVIGAVIYEASAPGVATAPAANADQAVRDAVTGFGKELQMVSLLAPDAGQTIQTDYAPYVAPELLSVWVSDPAEAPGRTTSSPWPDHIDITSAALSADGSYAVAGNVIEMTSDEVEHGGSAGSYPVTMTLENRSGTWLITNFSGYPEGGA